MKPKKLQVGDAVEIGGMSGKIQHINENFMLIWFNKSTVVGLLPSKCKPTPKK